MTVVLNMWFHNQRKARSKSGFCCTAQWFYQFRQHSASVGACHLVVSVNYTVFILGLLE